MSFSENFKIAYKNLYELHPPADNTEFRFRYLKVDWFFPNHLHNVLDNVRDFGQKYFKEVDLDAAMFGALFHDAGLVYERAGADPKGHESKSVEYAQKELKKLGYEEEFIGKVSECIRATEPDHETSLPEALLVRNADSYAHLMSMHFFAKANFAGNIFDYISWFDKKVNATFFKLTIEDLITASEPLIKCYQGMIANYRKNKDRDFLGEIHE